MKKYNDNVYCGKPTCKQLTAHACMLKGKWLFLKCEKCKQERKRLAPNARETQAK